MDQVVKVKIDMDGRGRALDDVFLEWTIRTYLIRVAGKLLSGNRQLTVKTPGNHLYPQVWDDWVAVGLGS